jgi:hypothetical protein
MPSPNLATAAVKASGAPGSRTLAAHFGDIVNVKSFGATGDGTTNDQPAIQAAFDYAFGTSGSPHAVAGRFTNKPVFFPVGNYRVNSGLTLTQVSAGHIYGSGSGTTTIFYGGGAWSGTVLAINGMQDSQIEKLSISNSGAALTVCIDLDWNGTGTVGLTNNSFADMGCSNAAFGIRIANTGNAGDNNTFINCSHSTCSDTGFKVVGANALAQTFISGGASNCGVGIRVTAGSIDAIIGSGFASNTTWDIIGKVNLVHGIRSESNNFINVANPVSIVGGTHNPGSAGTSIALASPGKAVVDAFHANTNGVITGSTGNLYLRGCDFNSGSYLTGFTGTVSQNI